MASIQGDSVRKGPLRKLRELARAILSATAEEEMRLQHQDLLKEFAKSTDERVDDSTARGPSD